MKAKYLGGSWVDDSCNYHLTIGKVYEYVLDSDGDVVIRDDNGASLYLDSKKFEDVSSENIIDKDDIIKTLESIKEFMHSLWCRVDEDVWNDLYAPQKLVRDTLKKLNQ